jgi:hypothetical protein
MWTSPQFPHWRGLIHLDAGARHPAHQGEQWHPMYRKQLTGVGYSGVIILQLLMAISLLIAINFCCDADSLVVSPTEARAYEVKELIVRGENKLI